MKLLLFVFLFTLLASSYAVTLKAKSKAFLKALAENKDTHPSFKAAFKHLLQLADSDEYQQVYDILGTVKDEITALLNKNQQRASDEDAAYQAQLQQYEAAITDIQSQIDKLQTEINNNNEQKDNIQQIITNAGGAIADAVNAQDNEVQRRQNAAQVAQDNVKSFDEAIASCNQAINLLQQAEAEDLPDSSAQFLEVRSKRLHKSLLEVGMKIKSIKIISPAVPFIESLISIAQNTINQDDFDQIISLINELKATLQSQRDTVVSDDAEDAQNSQNTLDSLKTSIEAQQQILAQNQQALGTVTDLIATEESQLESLQTTLDTATDLLNALDEAHAERATNFQALIDRLTRDIASLDQALSFLNSQMSD